MLKLYKMELYKILFKKSTMITGAVILLIMLFYFIQMVSEDRTFADGRVYSGYLSVKRDREITREFEGTFTDETVRAILLKYPLPKEAIPGSGQFKDSNFPTQFITAYLTDGFVDGWDYRIPQSVYSISSTELGKFLSETNKEIEFGYSKGWRKLLEFLCMFYLFVCGWIILAVSPVFAEEHQFKMQALIFTSLHGKTKGTAVKIAAGFSAAGIAYAFATILSFLLVGSIYSFEGGKMLNGLTWYYPSSYQVLAGSAISVFTLLYLIVAGGAMLLLTAMVLWVSARQKSVLPSFVTSLAIWLLPCFLVELFRLNSTVFYDMVRMLPLCMVMPYEVLESFHVWWLHAAAAILICVYCICSGYRKYGSMEVN